MTDLPQTSLAGVLLGDVAEALARNRNAANQSSRRDVVRTSYAAIEGLVWIYREHIIDIASMTANIDTRELAALSETSYFVTGDGVITDQSRFLSLRATLRLAERIAQQVSPLAKIDFSVNEFSLLQKATETRNRVTHPKTREDLELQENEVDGVVEALFWLLEVTSESMDAANKAGRRHVIGLSQLLEKLKRGDPQTMAAYEEVAREIDADFS
jgi:hypothetical protein